MALAEKINRHVQQLPERMQTEVLDFVEFLISKSEQQSAMQENHELTNLSLSFAMRGMEDNQEPAYSVSDLKEPFS